MAALRSPIRQTHPFSRLFFEVCLTGFIRVQERPIHDHPVGHLQCTCEIRR
jgi:hypothetical protein